MTADGIKVIVAALVLLGSGAFLGYSVGVDVGALRPIEYTESVPMDKVLDWCEVTGGEELLALGATEEQINEHRPDIQAACRDRWLAYSWRWERGEIP